MAYNGLFGGLFRMVLSKVLVDAMLRSDCGCQSPDAPDDMVLGQCYRMFSLHTVHSSSFHQVNFFQHLSYTKYRLDS